MSDTPSRAFTPGPRLAYLCITATMLMWALGVVVGWWFQDPRSADDATAWLEQGPDEQ